MASEGSEGSPLEQVTPAERQLFFAAAHAHFQNGCPLVAIEVMRKLPKRPLLVEEEEVEMENSAKRRRKSLVEIEKSTGTLKDTSLMNGFSGENGVSNSDKASDLFSSSTNNQGKTDSFSWGSPISSFGQKAEEKSSNFDWSTPTSAFGNKNTSDSIDWGAPAPKVAFKTDDTELDMKDLGFGDSSDEDSEAD